MTTTAGELERYGFEEPEPGRVVDSPQNRRHVRLLGSNWAYEVDVDEEMRPTGLLRVFTPEQMTNRRNDVYERRRDLLVDPDDRWSDYLPPTEWPLDPDAPAWVLGRAQHWRRQERNGIPESERSPLPTRCDVIRTDETRCWNWASHPERLTRCRAHASWEPTDSQVAAYARNKLLEMAPDAVDRLEYLSQNADGEAVQLKATTEILDRAGIKGGTELDVNVEVSVNDPAADVKSRLEQLADRAQKRAALEAAAEQPAPVYVETVQGEVVPDE